MRAPIGVTLTVPSGKSAIGVYEDESGIPVFSTNAPYLLSDGKSLCDPMPVFDAGGPIYQDSMGNVRFSLAVSGLNAGDDEDGITWDNNTPWDGGTFWS